MLRGAFGHALRGLVCPFGPDSLCDPCPLRSACAYRRIFEPPLEGPPPAFLPGLRSAPRPYVFEPGPATTELAAGDLLTFDLLLFGPAMALAPYALVAVERMAALGLGTPRHRFALIRAEAPEAPGGSRRLQHDGRWATGAGPALAGQSSSLAGGPAKSAAIDLLTPLRFSHWDEPTTSLPRFRTLVHLMLRRALEMTHFYGETPAPREWTYRAFLEAADRIEVRRSDLRVEDWSRFSRRQERPIPMAGLVGRLEIDGDLRPFLPLFAVAQTIHVGKGATLGLGRIRVALGGPDRS